MRKVKTGIYIVTNNINGKVYIGQSRNIKKRWGVHKNFPFNENNKKYPQYHTVFYRALRKYGLENFEFKILEECSIELLNEREIFYMEKYNSTDNNYGYNNTEIIMGKNTTTIWDDKTLLEVINLLRDFNYSIKDIADKYNVDVATIHYINRGDFLTIDNFKYPIRDKFEYNKFKREETLKLRRKDEDYIRICSHCEEEFFIEAKSSKQKFCSVDCANYYRNYNINNITKEELEKLIIFKSFEEIGRIYNVSGKAVSKWCIKFGLPSKRSDINMIYKDVIEDYKKSKIKRECVRCGSEFYSKDKIFCSEKCLKEKTLRNRTKGILPSIEEILYRVYKYDSINDLSFSFNISYKRFKEHCDMLGIPSTIKDLREYKENN